MDSHRCERASRALREDGVCILRGVIPVHEIKQLRVALEEVFERGNESRRGEGLRFDMTATANRIRDAGHGDNLLEEQSEAGTGGRFLTELEVGRWHAGVRTFELKSTLPAAVARVLGETQRLQAV